MEDNIKEVIEQMLARAECLEDQGEPREALVVLRNALYLQEDPLILTRIGVLAMDLNQFADAEEALLQATTLDPSFALAFFYLGNLYRLEGRLVEAQGSLERASGIDPSEFVLTLLGVVQSELGLDAEASESYRRAIRTDPTHQEAYFNLALLEKEHQIEEAVNLLEKAIDIDSHYQAAHRELGWLLRRRKQFAEAEYHLRRAVELDDSDGWGHIYLGNLMWQAGDLGAAEESFLTATRVWPDRSAPFWCFGYFRERQGRRSEADLLYRRALELNPLDSEANWRFGNYLKDIGDRTGAERHLNNALILNPANAKARAALSEIKKAL